MAKIGMLELVRIADFLDEIKDPRRVKYGNIRHKLVDIIVIAFTAPLCGYEYYEEMEEFERLKEDFFRKFLELPNRIPDESAFRRVLQCLNPLSTAGRAVEMAHRHQGAGESGGR